MTNVLTTMRGVGVDIVVVVVVDKDVVDVDVVVVVEDVAVLSVRFKRCR